MANVPQPAPAFYHAQIVSLSGILARLGPQILFFTHDSTSLHVLPDLRASITASATFGHSASPDNVTWWHIMACQGAMQVYVKY